MDFKAPISFPSILTTLIILCPFQSCSVSKNHDYNKFESFTSAFYKKESSLLSDGLQHVIKYDHLPDSDGVFSDFINLLCPLPSQSEHLPNIIKIIQKSDPYLQEAGIKLATAYAARRPRDYSSLEDPLCAILKQSSLDPWVLSAINKFVSVNLLGFHTDFRNFYSCYNQVVFQTRPNTTLLVIGRQMGIAPYYDAKMMLVQSFISQSGPTPRSMISLPYLEKLYKTQGWKETYDVAKQNAMETRKLPGE